MTWSERTDASNFERNVAFLKQHVLPLSEAHHRHLTLFSHVPKTAGTSLESYLAQQHRLSDIVHINAPDLNRLPAVLTMKKHFPKLICGHHPMHGMLYQLLPAQPLVHFTVIREPISRVLSYFNYVMAKTDHPMHPIAVQSGLQAFIEASPSPELNNGQTRRFVGQLHRDPESDEALVHLAQQVLTDCFSAVLLTEHLVDNLSVMAPLMGWQTPQLPQQNRSPQHTSMDDLSPQTRSLIEHRNQADIALYQWCQNQPLN